jgi:DNA-binding SARP family transcriptional activator
VGRGIDFRVLGPLEVEAGIGAGVLDVGGPRLRALLAMLVAAAGRPVSVAALVEGLWGQHSPEDADRTVRTYMSRLRKALQPADLIMTRPPGYVLTADPETVDAVRFERLATAGRLALEAGELAVAGDRLSTALSLWRGSAYDEFATIPSLNAERMRLEQVRHTTIEDRIETELAAGQGRELIAELETLTATYPGHERLWGQLMMALYRAGRQAEALATFRRARLVLVAESGVEPSPVLTAIHQQILAQDSGLLGPPEEVTPASEPLLAAGSRALLIEGNLLTSRQHFEAAYQAAEQAGDASRMALAMLGVCGLWVHEHRTATGTNQIRAKLRQALAAVDPKSVLALRLRVRLAGEAAYPTTNHAEILAMLTETRRADDPVAKAEALSIAHHCVLGPDHGLLRRSLAVELIGESSRTGRRVDRLMGLLWHTVDLFLAADPHAERRLRELEEALAEENHLAVSFAVSTMRAMLTIRAGRFADAEAAALACAELGRAAGDIDTTGWYGRTGALIDVEYNRQFIFRSTGTGSSPSRRQKNSGQLTGKTGRQRPGRTTKIQHVAGNNERNSRDSSLPQRRKDSQRGLRPTGTVRRPTDNSQPGSSLLRLSATHSGSSNFGNGRDEQSDSAPRGGDTGKPGPGPLASGCKIERTLRTSPGTKIQPGRQNTSSRRTNNSKRRSKIPRNANNRTTPQTPPSPGSDPSTQRLANQNSNQPPKLRNQSPRPLTQRTIILLCGPCRFREAVGSRFFLRSSSVANGSRELLRLAVAVVVPLSDVNQRQLPQIRL